MRTIIAGSRDFTNFSFLKEKLDSYILENTISEIVCGCACGADSLGEKWAVEKGIPVKKFPAQWNTFGRSAGYIRNTEMAIYSDSLIVFWDGRSSGIGHMIKIAREKGLGITIFIF